MKKMKEKPKEMKFFNMRIEKEMWKFIKKIAAEQETSMMKVINGCLNKFKKSHEKRVDEE